MRLAFLGSPAFAVPVLDALVDAGHDVVLVVTRPDRPRGRGRALAPTPVRAAAAERAIPAAVELSALESVPYDLGVVVAYGELVRPNHVHLVGYDLDGNELSIEASELEGRCFQHELDHLDGILLVERLDPDQRREARRLLRSEYSSERRDPDGLASLLEL